VKDIRGAAVVRRDTEWEKKCRRTGKGSRRARSDKDIPHKT